MPFSDADREGLFAELSAHAAADHLDLAELERRVAAVSAAETLEQAHAVLADLPPLSPEAAAAAGGAGHPGVTPESGEAGRPRWGRGHGEATDLGPGWRATAERFRDPKTRRIMRVWEDGSGARRYVKDG